MQFPDGAATPGIESKYQLSLIKGQILKHSYLYFYIVTCFQSGATFPYEQEKEYIKRKTVFFLFFGGKFRIKSSSVERDEFSGVA